ncbi:MAG TPA: hypothetical protein DIW15_00200 [Bavariicoccus seileri]|uniref:DUF5659 domain-containing protein n=1 Tax=Bavariicoccus seileri TaxID=549685 RepID=A0A3D4S3B6_9ENTE|nr:hypothetical protein [Bavariicoccus seileri]HCS93116.1 hypothetical protein [Bavariicoccus seileri]
MRPIQYTAFYCYDKKLSLMLKDKGYTRLAVATNQSSNNQFAIYVRDEQLDKEIKQYYKTNKIK